MRKALTMFNELEFKIHNSGDSFLVYKYESDYEEIWVNFNFEIKTHCVSYHRFIDNNERVFVPMSERPQNIKHSARYGYWQAEIYNDIGIRLHNAIHQQMIELGWIN